MIVKKSICNGEFATADHLVCSKPALAGRAIYALLARAKRRLVARAPLPRIDVVAATGARHADEFFIAWPP